MGTTTNSKPHGPMSMQNKNLIPVEQRTLSSSFSWIEEHVEPFAGLNFFFFLKSYNGQIVPYLCWQTLNSWNELNAASGWTHLQYNARHEFFIKKKKLYLAQWLIF